MALPKGVKSPVDYRDLYLSNELEGDVVSEKKMTKKQIKKRDEIADAISTREMNKRYGDKNVKYAIATKLAMKEGLGATGPKTAPLTQQSLDARKKEQSNITSKMNQLGGITKTTSQNGKLSSMSIQGVGAGTNKDALASVLPKSGTGVKMDADGVVPDAGAAVQQQAMKGIKMGQNTMSNNPTKFTSTQKQDFNTAKNYATSGQIKTDINLSLIHIRRCRRIERCRSRWSPYH